MSETPQILADEQDCLVLLKPRGWSTHDAGPASHPTLSHWLKEQRFSDAHPVHRLDKPTSGIVLVGKSKEFRTRLSSWFASGDVHKEYIALVHGKCRAQGTWKRPLSDSRRGKPLKAITHYRRIEHWKRYSLVHIALETGRKHQIRRHFEGGGHPIVGDTRYRGKRTPEKEGLFLHATFLALPDGRSYEAPLPEPFRERLIQLGSSPP